MQELIELRTFCVKEIEKAHKKGYHSALWKLCKPVTIKQRGRLDAFSLVIKKLDLILNNSVVKPSERRSPTDETFSGCKPPDERQNPLEEILLCGCKLLKVSNNCYARELCGEHLNKEFSNIFNECK